MDERIRTLADSLVRYSCQVKAGDRVYIHYTGESTRALAKELVRQVYAAGGLPFVHYTDPQLQRLQIMQCTKEQMELMEEALAGLLPGRLGDVQDGLLYRGARER